MQGTDLLFVQIDIRIGKVQLGCTLHQCSCGSGEEVAQPPARRVRGAGGKRRGVTDL